MRRFFYQCFQLKNIVFLGCVLSLSVIAKGQNTTPPPQAKTTVSDDDMDSENTATTDSNKVVKPKKNDNKFIVFADFGGSTIYTGANGTTTSAPGLTWAVSGQLAHQYKVKSKTAKLFLSVGLELRNFNGTLSTPDGVGSNAYDNYHFWYAGIPVMFQLVNIKHKLGNINDAGFYVQEGLTLGFKVDMLDVYSIQGNNSWNNVNDNYTMLMLHEYLSAGVAYRTKTNTFLLGPYLGYVINNISKTDGVTQNVLSYGARFSVLLFK